MIATPSLPASRTRIQAQAMFRSGLTSSSAHVRVNRTFTRPRAGCDVK